MQISSVLQVGDTVYSASNGQPMKVIDVYTDGFDTDVDYFSYDEHRKLFWLTMRCYLDSIKGDKNEYILQQQKNQAKPILR